MQLATSKNPMSLMSKFGRMRGQKAAEESHVTYFSLVCIHSYCSLHLISNIFVEASNGTGFIHKSKLNTNGTFSVGKTWRLAELRAVQVVEVCSIPPSGLCGAEYCLKSSRWLSISPYQGRTDGKLKIKRISPLSWRLWFDSSVLLPLLRPCTWMAC